MESERPVITLKIKEKMSERYTQKFRAKVDGRWRVVYYIDAIPRNVLKIDGEHTYLWYRDARVDISTMSPIVKGIEGVKREIHETESISNRTDIP